MAAGVPRGSAGSVTAFVSDPDQLKSAREDIKELLKTTFCHPILVFFFSLHLVFSYGFDVRDCLCDSSVI